MPSNIEDYTVLEAIGTGTYGTCRKIMRKRDGRILVWKEMDYGKMGEEEKQLIVSEVNLLRELRHQHIVRYYDRIIDRNNTTLYLIMEYCEGGDLSSVIEKYRKDGRFVDESFVWKISVQLISALKECHTYRGKTILHRDLKPANVFLDGNMNVKLGDFGLARVLCHDTSFAKTFVGTPYYMAPEQMNNMPYNEKCDIWSLGCLLYELCALKPPFTALNQKDLAQKISFGRFSRLPFCFSDDLNTFIACMIRVDECKRPTIDDLLEHPVVKSSLREDAANNNANVNLKSSSESVQSVSNNNNNTQEVYHQKLKLLQSKEASLLELEKLLKEQEQRLRVREMALDEKEKKIAMREKLADERLFRPLQQRHLNLLNYKGKHF